MQLKIDSTVPRQQQCELPGETKYANKEKANIKAKNWLVNIKK